MEAFVNRAMEISFGELISIFYEQFLEMYGDEELAAVAAATAINELFQADTIEVEEELNEQQDESCS
ncbi:hypothetical protein CO057_01095 [Candidatus Uhrbacteria bacterium CG_4_9_14_0_2_um_filter_41_50]|uniref:Uncharacterized protein n=1 Tax=Candidatus Uhrbacteria bacterium CG_4_9_14_0_2_um_filter_41_50 TaxID=1975031 RepID=A0A2M8EPX9_9BACT|nr:MAG: hypothetical protein COZ45_02860 [Candidatus Uhrbacteria bacterium CG_4_10_14_3_um_filter_41_21]PIZ54308.1 MAG: hypothetical protein COY24_04280 [Candidatus Uhrbacteria bacterium CG_4_10_14_0_2_um_filter_41_21]PJB85063.1 MAG: hypothetical protein CO086_00340 [Candidatus Uhrbacteria bacterium CG_4_9_14_0_8_um_filter_41_16]PJC24751.1 MAG: hypothetical protein CO057_01095 [Candidatus Uhrbacteria bacterium CG_4_9_14_0_2_um_filter_41_50]PJE75352.1 MAG: hypothetical protein COV03_00515 [Candi